MEKLVDLNSSQLLEAVYFAADEGPRKAGEMTIVFAHGGKYVYSNVSPLLWQDFKNAEEHGKFFRTWIKGQPEFAAKKL